MTPQCITDIQNTMRPWPRTIGFTREHVPVGSFVILPQAKPLAYWHTSLIYISQECIQISQNSAYTLRLITRTKVKPQIKKSFPTSRRRIWSVYQAPCLPHRRRTGSTYKWYRYAVSICPFVWKNPETGRDNRGCTYWGKSTLKQIRGWRFFLNKKAVLFEWNRVVGSVAKCVFMWEIRNKYYYDVSVP